MLKTERERQRSVHFCMSLKIKMKSFIIKMCLFLDVLVALPLSRQTHYNVSIFNMVLYLLAP